MKQRDAETEDGVAAAGAGAEEPGDEHPGGHDQEQGAVAWQWHLLESFFLLHFAGGSQNGAMGQPAAATAVKRALAATTKFMRKKKRCRKRKSS